ncbi:MAG: glycosyltransferase [Actinomycetota bacterium]
MRTTLVRSLVELGHVATGFDPRWHGDDAHTRTEALDALLAGVDADWCVVVPSPGDLDLGLLRSSTAERGILTLALHASTTFSEATTRLDDIAEQARIFDLVAVPHADAAARWYPYLRHGMVQLPPAVTPEVLDERFDGAVVPSAVVCVGDADHDAADVVRSLRDVGLDVGVLGRGWDELADLRCCDLGRPGVRERSALLAAAEVVVELPATLGELSTAATPWEETLLSQSALDAAALGTAVVALDRPGIGEHLEPEHELLVAADAGDLPDLLRMVLSTPEALRAVGLAAQERMRVEHQWRHRWTSLLDWLGAESPSGSIATTDGLAIVVPVAPDVDAGDVAVTISSLHDTEARHRLVVAGAAADLDRCLAADLDDDVDVLRVSVPGGDDGVRVLAGIANTSARYLTVVRPGTVWPAGRLDRQVRLLDEDPLLDAVVARHEHFEHFHRWDLLRRWVSAGSVQLDGTVLRRSSLVERVGPALLAGRVESLTEAVRSLRFRSAELDELIAGVGALEIGPEHTGVLAAFPQIQRCEAVDQALAAAFTALAADVAEQRPELARELAALALDHLEGGDEELAAIATGRGPADRETLRAVEHRLGIELRAVAPTAEDQVWHQSGGTLANHRLVLDVDWDDPTAGLRLIADYSRRFLAGEPVELAVLAESASVERVIAVVAESLAHDGIDIESAANVTLLDRYERCDGDLVIRLRNAAAADEAVAEAEAWMEETRLELDALGV